MDIGEIATKETGYSLEGVEGGWRAPVLVCAAVTKIRYRNSTDG